MAFFSICMELLQEELNEHRSLDDYDVTRAIKYLQNAYHVKSLTRYKSDVCYNKPVFRCAYMYRYAPWHFSVIENLTSKMLRKCHRYIPSDLFFIKGLRITCLGGGPGIDAIAFLRAVGKKYNLCDFTDVNVTVIDFYSGWNHTMDKLFTKLQSNTWFNDDIQLPSKCEFLRADLTKHFSSEVLNAIESADVVTMFKFVSAVDGSNRKEKVPHMLQKIFRHLKTDAFLFFIDNAGGHCYEMIDREAKEWKEVIQIYGPDLHKPFQASCELLKRMFMIHSQRFGLYPMFKTRVSAGMWKKCGFQNDEDSNTEDDDDSNSEDDDDSSTETAEDSRCGKDENSSANTDKISGCRSDEASNTRSNEDLESRSDEDLGDESEKKSNIKSDQDWRCSTLSSENEEDSSARSDDALSSESNDSKVL